MLDFFPGGFLIFFQKQATRALKLTHTIHMRYERTEKNREEKRRKENRSIDDVSRSEEEMKIAADVEIEADAFAIILKMDETHAFLHVR